jgi:hypothetical protein
MRAFPIFTAGSLRCGEARRAVRLSFS